MKRFLYAAALFATAAWSVSAAPQTGGQHQDNDKCCLPLTTTEPPHGPGCPAGVFDFPSLCNATGVAGKLVGGTCTEGEGYCEETLAFHEIKMVPAYDCVAVSSQNCVTGQPCGPYTCAWVQNGTLTLTAFGYICHPNISDMCQ
ncbi:MAG: hypothetical protein AAF682_19785 [Planctomycetota bacterium]